MAAKGRRILYQTTADAIREQITSGELAPGDQVGASLGSLAREHKVGIATIRAALAILSNEGLVETIPGKGTFVLAVDREGEQQSDVAALARAVAELREEVRDLDVSVMELYARLGYEHHSQRKERREHAG